MPARGRGLGTEATRFPVDYGLVALGLNRISLEVYDVNPRACHVYEKVGLVHEGTERQA
ncbi:GNAT family protein [Nesterenkonia sp. HG001]|uniref:GNAT family N-acetyltransferase n=1 Tax=Nesterenkonia sp. HG001 TaxID=2983207 RepID=UPI002AC495D8|nr:GNAT family protein [Nesterenkonia sp. HG001]MDZ5078760.1 GNAT family N-acetyltransferase [Nesterenkonia sp. HG001]